MNEWEAVHVEVVRSFLEPDGSHGWGHRRPRCGEAPAGVGVAYAGWIIRAREVTIDYDRREGAAPQVRGNARGTGP